VSRYSLVISENERILLTVALVQRSIELELAGMTERADSYINLLHRLREAPKLSDGQASAPSTAASGSPRTAAAVSTARQSAPVVTTSEKPVAERVPDKETGELTITPVSVEQDGKAMVVSYRIRSGEKVRLTKSRCFDPKLFSALLATVGETTTFLTRESKGFLNIVGVKP